MLRRLPRRLLRAIAGAGRIARTTLPPTCLLLLWATLPDAVVAQAEPRPLRLGMLHPHPRLCLGQEPAQRDLRVLRRAFGLLQVPGERLALPWFYAVLPALPARPGVWEVALRSEALWAVPAYRLAGGHPEGAGSRAEDRLSTWRGRLHDAIASLAATRYPSLAAFRVAERSPWLGSRLAGSALLPYTTHRNGATAPAPCRDWPRGVTLQAGDERRTYTLRSAPPAPGAPYRLSGYRAEWPLLRDYFWGRLDAVLLEGPELDGRIGRYRASQMGPWARVPGTQQIVLRFAPHLAASLGLQGRLALSLALRRERLATVDGPGRFLPADRFLLPVLAGEPAPAAALGANTIRARRQWLELELPAQDWRLGVLAHPVLERLAARLQAQWARTLNVAPAIQPLGIDVFQQAVAQGEVELYLDVVDLDDGSLQSLWDDALERPRGTPQPAQQSPRWERQLRERLPYLPLLNNVHHVLLRRDASPELRQRVCPGCRAARAPLKLRPEPREREDPQG